MPWFLGGIVALGVVFILMRAFANADPAKIVRALQWTGIAVASLIALGFLVRGSVFPAMLAFGAAGAIRATLRRQGASSGGASSDVETDWLRMSLDHASGETSGLVLKGKYAGRRLAELDLDQLIELLGEVRIADPQSALLLEAYLKRLHPEAEERMAGGEGAPSPSAGGPMGREEALEILGLEDGADEDAIRDAHRRLMQQVHPDKGGSDYLAAKINQARDVLLKR